MLHHSFWLDVVCFRSPPTIDSRKLNAYNRIHHLFTFLMPLKCELRRSNQEFNSEAVRNSRNDGFLCVDQFVEHMKVERSHRIELMNLNDRRLLAFNCSIEWRNFDWLFSLLLGEPSVNANYLWTLIYAVNKFLLGVFIFQSWLMCPIHMLKSHFECSIVRWNIFGKH